MDAKRKDHRRRDVRSFRPDLDGRLEDRCLLSSAVFPRTGSLVNHVQTFVKDGGRAVRVFNGLGSAFDVQITGPGTVTAAPLPNGTIKLVVTGSDPTTELAVNPVREVFNDFKARRQAHNFHPEFGFGNHLLNIGELDIKSGRIGSILGFRTATLSGPLVITGSTPVSRIALYQLLPGATIVTGGDLDTLDIFNNATLSGAGTGLNIGRDLNLLNINGDLTIQNGANLIVGRDIGATPQPPKGSGTGSNILQVLFNSGITATTTTAVAPLVGGFIQGNITIAPGSVFKAVRAIDLQIYVQGNVSGFSRFSPQTIPPGQPIPPVPPATLSILVPSGSIVP
jgi:hypothetical protein